MLYSNPEFFIFLPIILVLYFLAGATQNTKRFLLINSSFFFIIWAGIFDTIIFIFILLVSWGSVYFANRTSENKLRQIYLAIGIVIMVLHLFYWKYMPWIGSIIQEIFPNFLEGERIKFPLPVGISFFTLQGIAYLIDYGRNNAKYMPFKDYMLFKSFFPQLVAGPIVRMQQIGTQLQNLPDIKWWNIRDGLFLFSIGFFKKVAIADRMAVIVDPVFADPSRYTTASICFAILAYTVQIWGDFSGYTDMGRGAAKMFGINLPENFYSPYLSKSPSEFWRRWHITLSQWIRDYIYLPLGGSDGSIIRIAMVVIFTMIVSGLWHGAALTFLTWGFYHGILLVFERLAKYFGISIFEGRLAAIFTFILVMIGWLIFRSESMENLRDTVLIIIGVIPEGDLNIGKFSITLAASACFFYQLLTYKNFEDGEKYNRLYLIARKIHFSIPSKAAAILSGISILSILLLALFLRSSSLSSKFIYFQF
jgi:alginate O-acetyltransferase complex protein AlgI